MPSEASRLEQLSGRRNKTTACFVHHVLDKERNAQRAGDVVDNGLSKVVEHAKKPLRDSDDHGDRVHSRLLTKTQLSDMAWGVRELSRKLSSIRLKLHVKGVFLLTKAHDEELIGYTRRMAEWLLAREESTPYIVFVTWSSFLDRGSADSYAFRYVEQTLEHNRRFDAKGLLSKHPSFGARLKYWTTELCRKHPQTFDIVITVRTPIKSYPPLFDKTI